MRKSTFRANYIIVPLITIVTSLIGGYATSLGLMSWYQGLILPAIAPAGNIIGFIWTVIYILTTISALIYVNKAGSKDKNYNVVISLFIANAVLNALWSFVFFAWHSLGGAIIEMIILEITNIALIIYIWKRSNIAAYLLLPYLIWVAFATYLAIQIFLLNV